MKMPAGSPTSLLAWKHICSSWRFIRIVEKQDIPRNAKKWMNPIPGQDPMNNTKVHCHCHCISPSPTHLLRNILHHCLPRLHLEAHSGLSTTSKLKSWKQNLLSDCEMPKSVLTQNLTLRIMIWDIWGVEAYSEDKAKGLVVSACWEAAWHPPAHRGQ